jgi:anthranilate synthase component I
MLTKELFFDFGRQGFSLVPLYKEVKFKNIRSVDVYSEFDEEENNFILEFIKDNNPGQISYSVIGIGEISVLEVYDEKIQIIKNGSVTEEFLCKDPFVKINNYVTQYRVPFISEIPFFSGGLVGYVLEDEASCNLKKKDCVNERPNSKYLRSEELVVYDCEKDSYYIIVQAEPNWEESYYFAINRIDEIIGQLTLLDKNRGDSYFVNKETINLKSRSNVSAKINYDKLLHQNDFAYHLSNEKNKIINFYVGISDASISNHKYMLKFSGEYIVGSSSGVMVSSDSMNIIKKSEVISDSTNNKLQAIDLQSSNVVKRIRDIDGMFFLENIINKFKVNSYFKRESLSYTITGESFSDNRIDHNDFKKIKATNITDLDGLRNKYYSMGVKKELCNHCIGYFDWYGNINLVIADNAVFFKKNKSTKYCEN